MSTAGAADRIVMVGRSLSNGSIRMIHQAIAQGLTVDLVINADEYDADHAAVCERTFVMEHDGNPALPGFLTALYRDTPFIAVLGLSEFALAEVAHVNHSLGLPGFAPNAVAVTRDKFRMRQALDAAGLPGVSAALVESRADIAAFAETVGFPVIVKPQSGAGSVSVMVMTGPDDIADLPDSFFASRLLAETFLDGPEVSAESFSRDGRHTILAITEKATSGARREGAFVELGHCVPARIARADAEAIRAMTRSVLGAVGITDGPAHTELKLTADGPRVIETHTRVGGDNITELVQLTTGYDMDALTMAWLRGAPTDLPETAITHGAAAIRFIEPVAGVFRGLIGQDTARCDPSVNAVIVSKPTGTILEPVASSSYARVGHVIATGLTGDAAVRAVNEAMSKLRVMVSPERKMPI